MLVLSLAYNKILRYAFAASYVYSLEQDGKPFAFNNDPMFETLMLPKTHQKSRRYGKLCW
ncbi:hypothetical protein ACPSKX_08325 [Moritella viscosa]